VKGPARNPERLQKLLDKIMRENNALAHYGDSTLCILALAPTSLTHDRNAWTAATHHPAHG
jgi:hypothetical protein